MFFFFWVLESDNCYWRRGWEYCNSSKSHLLIFCRTILILCTLQNSLRKIVRHLFTYSHFQVTNCVVVNIPRYRSFYWYIRNQKNLKRDCDKHLSRKRLRLRFLGWWRALMNLLHGFLFRGSFPVVYSSSIPSYNSKKEVLK